MSWWGRDDDDKEEESYENCDYCNDHIISGRGYRFSGYVYCDSTCYDRHRYELEGDKL